jgi:hypothetical protein
VSFLAVFITLSHFNRNESLLLVIVTLSSKDPSISTDALSAIDSALKTMGLRKQVRSTVIPGKEYAVTYDGPVIEKKQVEETVARVANLYHITFTVDVEESVGFP